VTSVCGRRGPASFLEAGSWRRNWQAVELVPALEVYGRP